MNFRKIFRFLKRLPKYIALCWKQENWDYKYLFDILLFKLEELKQEQKEDNLHVNSDKRAKQIAICIEHIKRYLDIDKYTYGIDIEKSHENISFIGAGSGMVKIQYKDNKIRDNDLRIYKHQNILAKWHLQEFLRKFEKYAEGWWT